MAKSVKAELLEFFFLEVTSYIPAIRQGLEILASERAALTAIRELHRLFHNIKGAASQVQLFDVSQGARVVETALDVLLAEERPISDPLLTALHQAVDLLISSSNDKNRFLATEQEGEGQNFHQQVTAIFATYQNSDAAKGDRHNREKACQQECMPDGRSIFPLLTGHLQKPDDLFSVDEVVDEDRQLLMAIFREECDEHFIVINQSLNHLEGKVKEPSLLTTELRASISEMRRALHTLKGAASMTGVKLLAAGAHTLEDLLDWLYDEAEEIVPEQVQRIAAAIDVMEVLSQSPEAGESSRLDSVVADINTYLNSRLKTTDIGAGTTDLRGRTVVEEHEAARQPVFVDIPAQPEPTDIDIPNDVTLPADAGILRVRMEDLDELVSIEGELVVARGAMEKMVEEFHQTLVELENIKGNLRRKSQELELGFEGPSLYGFNPVSAAGGSAVPTAAGLADFDPIELDRYSQFHLIVRSLNEISIDVNAIHASLTSLAGDISGQIGKQQLTMRLMQDKLMRIRMTPLSSISRVLFRAVRDTAAKLGKKASLRLRGEDVSMDRFIWAGITDPLLHILRNGIDHGIESAEVRAAAGKPEAGTITLHAEQRSRYVVLRITDDGGGIDLSLIREKISRDGLVAKPEDLGEKELLEYLFHPSFTTRQNITTLSGRGVGLDVVRQNIRNLRGSIQIHNTPGHGVAFEIHVPFTLSVNRAILVLVAGREFAVPLQDILQVKRFFAAEIVSNDDSGGLFLPVGDALVQVSNLGYHLQLEKKWLPRQRHPRGSWPSCLCRGKNSVPWPSMPLSNSGRLS